MNSIRINIINPKARKLIEDLEAMNLISISSSDNGFAKLLKDLRKNPDTLSLDEIAKEVDLVRSKRYESQ